MNRHLMRRFLLLLAVSFAMFGCGGGGSGGVAPTKAVLTVSLQGTLAAGTSIGAVDLTVTLPAGVTAKVKAGTFETADGVVVASGNGLGSIVVGNYTVAAATAPGTIRIGLLSANGITTGEILTLNLDISGAAPSISGFSTTGLSVRDINNNPIGGMAAALTLQLNATNAVLTVSLQ